MDGATKGAMDGARIDTADPRRKARLRIVAVDSASMPAESVGGSDLSSSTLRTAEIARRVEQRLEATALAWSPWVPACLALPIVQLWALGRADEASALAWIAFAVLVAVSFVVVPRTVARHGRPDHARAGCRAVVVCGVFALIAAFVFPYVAAPDASASRATALCLAAATVLAATVMFGARPRLVALPLVVPLGWIAVDACMTASDAAQRPVLIVPALVVAVLVQVYGRLAARIHRRSADEAVAAETRQHALAAARQAAEQSDHDKSRFLATASHDLRQPLHALGLFAASLEKRLRGTASEPIVTDLVQSIDWLGSSFNALMDVSQLDAGSVEPKFQRFPLRDLFRRLHMHFAGQAEMAGLAFRFTPGGKSVTSDPQLLERIVGNLIQNALKYTVRGGVVVVARTTATHFHIEVWDTGLGISDLELPRIFHEYYQIDRRDGARARGLGMGLAIVKRLVRLLGHELDVVSTPGRGSMFRVRIARGSLSEIEDATAAADTLPMTLAGQRTALIVDDDATIRRGLELLLTEWGYRSVCASDHDEACYALRVSESIPDLILCDLQLGDGPDGMAVIHAVRRQCGRQLPAILITGDPANHEIDRAVGSDLLILAKPVQPKRLRDALRSLEEAG